MHKRLNESNNLFNEPKWVTDVRLCLVDTVVLYVVVIINYTEI